MVLQSHRLNLDWDKASRCGVWRSPESVMRELHVSEHSAGVDDFTSEKGHK